MGLHEWMRDARPEQIFSMVMKPPSFLNWDSRPIHPGMMFGTQFAKLNARRMADGSMREDEDKFAVYLYQTSERRRSEDERRPLATQHENPEGQKRKMLYQFKPNVGRYAIHGAYMERCIATSNPTTET